MQDCIFVSVEFLADKKRGRRSRMRTFQTAAGCSLLYSFTVTAVTDDPATNHSKSECREIECRTRIVIDLAIRCGNLLVCHSEYPFQKQSPESSGLPEEEIMLWTIFVILLVLWLLGLVTSYTMGGFIHILLVLALVVLVFRIIEGRRVI